MKTFGPEHAVFVELPVRRPDLIAGFRFLPNSGVDIPRGRFGPPPSAATTEYSSTWSSSSSAGSTFFFEILKLEFLYYFL